MGSKKKAGKLLKSRKKITAPAKAKKLARKKRKKASKGKAIRISDEVHNFLIQKKNNGRTQSWDCFFRSVFGLPKRNGDSQKLLEGWLEQNSGQFYLKMAEANGASVVEAVKAGRKTPIKPMKMREVRW